MIVADTSALVSLATADSLSLVLDEFDVHTTETVLRELEETATYTDTHGDAAAAVLDDRSSMVVRTVETPAVESARVDAGEASCVALTREVAPDFLITDDLRAVPELQVLVDARIAISPIVLKALVERDVLTDAAARDRVERLADSRGWLGAPIYRRAVDLFEED